MMRSRVTSQTDIENVRQNVTVSGLAEVTPRRRQYQRLLRQPRTRKLVWAGDSLNGMVAGSKEVFSCYHGLSQF
jgi:hypothetical protein